MTLFYNHGQVLLHAQCKHKGTWQTCDNIITPMTYELVSVVLMQIHDCTICRTMSLNACGHCLLDAAVQALKKIYQTIANCLPVLYLNYKENNSKYTWYTSEINMIHYTCMSYTHTQKSYLYVNPSRIELQLPICLKLFSKNININFF